MYQAPATIWNAVAEAGPLRTAWAEQMFPLPQDSLDKALAAEAARIEEEPGSDALAAPYLTVMPLLWESEAISRLLEQTGPIASLPPVETVDEAMAIATNDFLLTAPEKATLREMLLAPPPES